MAEMIKSWMSCDCFKQGTSKKKKNKVKSHKSSKLKKHVEEISEEEVKQELTVVKSNTGSISQLKPNPQ